jgi:4-hydroxy-tetrahydrodipicolinate reductase
MGKLIETLADEKGHEVAVVIDDVDAGLSAADLADKLRGADAAIDFTVAAAVRRNVEACVKAAIPIVVGTTGWNDQIREIENLVREGNGAMVYAANFSIGVNLFYRIAEYVAELTAKFPEYEVFIEELHHSRKKDAPSGTALKLKEIASQYLEVGDIASTRTGNIPGTHRIGFDGPADQILLEHAAHSREGFASGAIEAAEWIVGRSGIFEFSEIVDEISGIN